MPGLTSIKGHKAASNELTENLAHSGSAAQPRVALNSPPSCWLDSHSTGLTMNSPRARQCHQLATRPDSFSAEPDEAAS